MPASCSSRTIRRSFHNPDAVEAKRNGVEPRSEVYVALFAVLADELRKTRKNVLALRLAEIWAREMSATLPDAGDPTDDLVARATERVRGMIGSGASPDGGEALRRSAPVRTRAQTGTLRPPRDPIEELEAVKLVVHQKFESWRAVKRGRHWHVGFARKMVEQHKCIAQERTVVEWAREWERQTRRPGPAA